MKKAGLIIFGIVAAAVILILIAVEIIEFALGAILFGIAALIIWGLYSWAKKKMND